MVISRLMFGVTFIFLCFNDNHYLIKYIFGLFKKMSTDLNLNIRQGLSEN